jgi:hypothetical protein
MKNLTEIQIEKLAHLSEKLLKLLEMESNSQNIAIATLTLSQLMERLEQPPSHAEVLRHALTRLKRNLNLSSANPSPDAERNG